jgi:DNA-binding transcriptional LysR family regulator
MQWDERIGRRLKLRDLHILMSAVQCGTMGKAAEHLAITQPAVSKAISDIEHTLKVRLLDRTAHGVEPTVYGRSLLKWGNAVFDDLRQGVKEIEYLSDPTAGELRIGCTEPMAWGIVPAVIERLTRQYPRLVFHVKQAEPTALRDRELRERNVELVIGRILEPLADDVQVETLFEERLFVVAGLQNRWARRRKMNLSELVDQPWSVGPPESFAGSLMADAFRAEGLPSPRVSSVTNSIPLHYALLASGRFLSILPGSLLRFSVDRMSLKVLPVKLRARPGPVGIAILKKRTLSPVAQLFIECLRDVAKPLMNAR